jgi:imidazolonepropionase-like amidohydrolase
VKKDMTCRYSRLQVWLPLTFGALVLFFALLCQAEEQANPLALVGGKVYTSPEARPLNNAVVLLEHGKIARIGKRSAVTIPKSAQVVDCKGKVITAGFWNSHVHFTEPQWQDAATADAHTLEQHMQEMLTRWGFTAVFDIGSFPKDTLALRRRVESGEIAGPKIYTTAGNIFPENGIPVYIPKELASQLKPLEAATPADSARLAKQSLELGGDAIKLFTGAIMGHGQVTSMPRDVVRAAVDVAHAAGKPVFAHPSNHIGTDNALAGGVDILAHTIPIEQNFTSDELSRMKAQHVALIPTLTLWEVELDKAHASPEDTRAFVKKGVGELGTYFKLGGPILFGTDVGYTQHYDTTEEYLLMAESGMGWRDILASLTSNPAKYFKAGNTGELAVGRQSDLVVLDGDPAKDVRNFAKVDYTIRAGKIIYQK